MTRVRTNRNLWTWGLYGMAQNLGKRGKQQDFFGFYPYYPNQEDDFAFIRHRGFWVFCAMAGEACRTAGRLPSVPSTPFRMLTGTKEATNLFPTRCCSRFITATSKSSPRPAAWGRRRIAVQRGLLTAEDAAAHPAREALTSFIGITELEEISRGSKEIIFPGSSVMLCSDGLSKVLTLEEIHEAFVPDPQEWAQRMVCAVLDKKNPYQNNVTVTVITRQDVAVACVTRDREQGGKPNTDYNGLMSRGITRTREG